MRKGLTLTLLAMMFSIASFAVASISGIKTVCVGGTTNLSDSTSGGVWTTNVTSVAVIGSGTGVVYGIAPGTTTVTYTVSSVSVFAVVTVYPAPGTIGGTKSVCPGMTTCLSDATTGGIWTSANPAVAVVGTTTGCVTGVSSGTATISYTLSTGCSTTVVVSVTAGPAAITGSSSVCIGSSIALTDITSGGSWSSSNTSLATVTSGGSVTGVSGGVVTISYTLTSGCLATKAVSVTSSSTISGPSTVCVGNTITLSDATGGGTWSTGGSSIATVTSGGVVTGVSSGVVNIYYSVGGCGAYHTVSVLPGASAITGPTTVCSGSTVTLSTSGGGSWSSSSPFNATVSSAGVVTGVYFGSVTIMYTTTSGCVAYHPMSVMGPTPVTGPSTVCIGSTITLSDSLTGGTWFSGSTAVATVTSGGVVTGVSAGTAVISYYMYGCVGTKVITVSSGVSSIGGPSTVCVGSTITLSDASSGGLWSSSSPVIATVGSTSGVVTGVSAGVVTITYSLTSGCKATMSITVTTGVSPITGPSTVCIGGTIALTDTTTGGTWSVGGSSIASVSSSGVVTGIGAGVINIYYVKGGCGTYHTVTVSTGGSPISGPSTVCVGSTITLSDAGSGGWTWSSSNTSVATINATSGVVTGISTGTATITFTSGGCSSTKVITVSGGAGSIGGPSTVCVGSTITLSDATSGGVWLSSNPSIASVGTTTGIVTGVSAGTVIISYYVSGCIATKTITVSGGSTITGPSTVCIGSTISLTDTTSGGSWLSGNTAVATVSSTGVVTGVSAGVVNIYYVTGGCGAYHTVTVGSMPPISGSSTVCVGSTTTLSDVGSGGWTWSSSNTSVATVNATSGVVTGVSAGTVVITFTSGGCYATKTMTVTTISSITGASTICVGSTTTLSDATSGGSWLTSNTAVATVSSGGVVTGTGAGVVNIYYTIGGCGTYHTMTVVTAPKSITGPGTVCVGGTITLSDSTSGGSWLCSSTSIATVSSGGVVTGISTGVVNIYYLIGSCGAYKSVTVTPGASSISGASTLCVGSTTTLSDATSGGVWSSSNSSVATISSAGVVTGVSSGTVTITYMLTSGCFATKTITVGGGAIYGPSTVCVGSTITLSDASTGGTWTTSSTSTATVSSAGVVTGVAAGVVNIYYLVGGCYAYHSVTVTGGAITGPSSVCVGSTITLSDAATGGTWLSSSTAIATISTSRVVTGVSTGVVNIYYSVGGCYAYHTVTVTPSVGSISGLSTVHVGSTITLSDGTSGGTWLSSNTTIGSVSTSGVVTGVGVGVINIYYVLGGCGAYHIVSVTAAPPGSIGGKITTGGAKGTSGESPVVAMAVNLKDGSGNIVATVNTDNSGDYTFSGLDDGSYTVYPTENGYTTIGSATIAIDGYYETATGVNFKQYVGTKTISPYSASGISHMENNGEISIFPNPTNGNFNIKWDGQVVGVANIVVSDVVGREVFNASVNIGAASGQAHILMPGLKNGMYMVTIKSDNINYSAKLMIQQ